MERTFDTQPFVQKQKSKYCRTRLVFSFERILKVNQYLQHSNSFIFQSTAILSLPCIIHPRKN